MTVIVNIIEYITIASKLIFFFFGIINIVICFFLHRASIFLVGRVVFETYSPARQIKTIPRLVPSKQNYSITIFVCINSMYKKLCCYIDLLKTNLFILHIVTCFPYFDPVIRDKVE